VGIEPDPRMASLLRANVEINWITNVVRVLNHAASDRPGKLLLRRQRGYSANTTIAGVETASENPAVEVFEIEAIPVDSLLSQLDGRIDFLKVDVEGAEPLVFRGARETIARNPKITILMEWSPDQLRAAGFDPAEFTDQLSALSLMPAALQRGGEAKAISWDDVRAMGYGDIVMRRRDS
jgi:FkbM family methyltransferase